ncbi:type II secretion system minor pseudopilin GspH [Pseudomonas sp. KU43P]|uniref:type II secretion system minor pseudopilin GspH n=1 Tax=Pseudomonas sp. KU43P TaxID=2487887 RepID=UPI0012A7D6A8|nr:type II secretion system minor pseudopilin GspH [Pseudomonas sp. KU43P]BBH43842.1 hypothetical protein KU43P_03190 [Pseudomonas sp. KU43P]
MRGFTLLELLVVLAVLGLVAGMAGLSLGRDPQRQAFQEANFFVQVLQHARQRAVLEGMLLGIRLDAQGYQLLRRTALGWDNAGQRHDAGIDLRLVIDDVFIEPSRSGSPQLLIHSNDQYSVFTLHFEQVGVRLVSVSSDGLNDPQVDH